MTFSIAYAAYDGYLYQTNASWANVQAGTGSTSVYTTTTSLEWGTSLSAGTYKNSEAFMSFTYSLVSGEDVVSASLRATAVSALNTGVSRQLNMYEYDFGATLDSSDYRTSTWVSSATLLGGYENAQNAGTQRMIMGSDNLTSRVATDTSPLRVVVVSSRFTSSTPSVDETASFSASERTGTSNDPALVWLSTPQHAHQNVLGAQVRLSSGAWAYLVSDGAATPTITLQYRTPEDTTSTIATIPTGSSTTDFTVQGSLQALALARDSSDNLYVAGRGYSTSVLAVKGYTKGAGATWTPATMCTVSMPTYTASITNVAATWHNVGGTYGTLVVFTARRNGNTDSVQYHQISYALMACSNILSGTSTATVAGAIPALVPYWGVVANVDGTGLDVQAPSDATTRGYVMSWSHAITHGDLLHNAARYTLSADGTSISSQAISSYDVWSDQNPAGKIRILAISNTLFAVVTIDSLDGWGPTIQVLQNVGTSSTFSELAYVTLDGTVATLPSASTLAVTVAWDALYDNVENTIWFYYTDVGDASKIYRTSVSLNTWLANGDEVLVVDSAATTIDSIRVERNARSGDDNVLVTYTEDTTSYYVIDSLNAAPTAPTLTPHASFDADVDTTFEWTFNDPNTYDSQSAYQLQVVDVSDSSVDVDTGKVVLSTESHVVTGGSLGNEKSFQWRVRTYDQDDAVSPWSTYGTFSTSASGTVTVIDPATDNQAGIYTSDYTVEWSVAGTTQADYRVVVTRTDTSEELLNTGWVTSTDTTYSVTGMLSDIEYQVAITVRDALLIESGTGTRLITPSYSNPEEPTCTATAFSDSGYILVSVTNPESGTTDIGTTPYDYESGVTEMTGTDCTVTQSSDYAYEGTYSAKMVVTGTPASASMRPTYATEKVAITAGQRYTISYRAYSVSGYASLADEIDWYDDSDVYISTASNSTPAASGAWTSRSHTAEAPAGAAYAVYGPTLDSSPATGKTLYVDILLLAVASDKPVPTGNKIYRRRSDGTGSTDTIATESDVGSNGSWRDYTAVSGVEYEYKARAVAPIGATDSEWTAGVTLTLSGVWLHDVLDPEGTIKQYPYGRSARSTGIDVASSELRFAGRTYPVVQYGDQQDDSYSISIIVPFGSTWVSDTTALQDFVQNRRTLYVRDNRGRAAYCTLSGYQERDADEGTSVSFTAKRIDYQATT